MSVNGFTRSPCVLELLGGLPRSAWRLRQLLDLDGVVAVLGVGLLLLDAIQMSHCSYRARPCSALRVVVGRPASRRWRPTSSPASRRLSDGCLRTAVSTRTRRGGVLGQRPLWPALLAAGPSHSSEAPRAPRRRRPRRSRPGWRRCRCEWSPRPRGAHLAASAPFVTSATSGAMPPALRIAAWLAAFSRRAQRARGLALLAAGRAGSRAP